MSILDKIKIILAVVFIGPSAIYGLTLCMRIMKIQWIISYQRENPTLNALFTSDFPGVQVFIGLAGISGVILLNSVKSR